MFSVEFGLQTYCVLLCSYIACCLPFEIIHQLKLFEDKRLQPKFKYTDALRWKAFTMVSFNFCWLFLVLLAASPILEAIFPVDQEVSPSVLIIVFQILLSFVVDDMSFYCYHRYLHANKELYILYHKPHHAFKAPFAWTVSI